MEGIDTLVAETASTSFPTHSAELLEEVTRIEIMIQEIAEALAEPNGDLVSTIQLTIHRSELIAYLKGLCYAPGGETEFSRSSLSNISPRFKH